MLTVYKEQEFQLLGYLYRRSTMFLLMLVFLINQRNFTSWHFSTMTEVWREKPAEPHIGQQSTLTNYGEAKAKRGKKAMTINNASVT